MLVRVLLVAPAAVLALALAGCGSGEGSADDPASADPSTESSAGSSAPTSEAAATEPAVPSGAPGCGEVWVAGADLPKSYQGCVQDEAYVEAAVLRCSSGQGIVRHDDRFWAVRGGTVSEAADIYKSKAYLATVRRCRG